MENIIHVLEKIKQKRKSQGISHEDFAFRLGISQAAYTNIENQTSKLSVERLLKISEILEEPVYSFFNENPSRIYNASENAIGHQEANEINNLNREMLEELVKSKDEQILLLKTLLEKSKLLS